MDTNTTTQTTADLFTADLYSPYQLAKAVNKILQGLGIEKSLPPQMFYAYTQADKGYIPTVGGDAEGKGRQVTKEAAAAWMDSYLVKISKA